METHYVHLIFGVISHIKHNYNVISIQFLMIERIQNWMKQNNINVPHLSSYSQPTTKSSIYSYGSGWELFIFWSKKKKKRKGTSTNWAWWVGGWMDGWTEEKANNLFKTVKRNDLEIREAPAFSPDGKQKQWSGPNCDITIRHTARRSEGDWLEQKYGRLCEKVIAHSTWSFRNFQPFESHFGEGTK